MFPCGGRGWLCPQMNKFEQVFSDHYQMSVAEGVSIPDGEGVGMPGGGYPNYPIIQKMYLTPPPRTEWQTPVKTLPSRNFVGAVIKSMAAPEDLVRSSREKP